MDELSKREIEIINILKTLINKEGYYTIVGLLEIAYEEVKDA